MMKFDRIGVRLVSLLLLLLFLFASFVGCTGIRLGSDTTATTEAPVTTGAPATTGAPETTEEPATTDAPETTAAPATTVPATTAAPETTGTEQPEPETLVDLLSKNDAIPAFNHTVLERMHLYYTYLYIGTLGTDAEMAETIEEYYTEYKYLIDETDSDDVTDLLCECYLDAAGDKYAYYMNPEALAERNSDLSGNYVGIGVQVSNDAVNRTVTVTAVFPNTPAFEAGILAGDTIEAVGDTPASTISFAELVNRIRGEEGTEVTVTFARNGEPYTRTMTRRTVVQVTASASILPGTPKIGLIQITEFDRTTAPQFKAALDELLEAGVEGLIFDLRNNPGGLLTSILAVLDYLVPDGTPLANYEYYDGSVESDTANAKKYDGTETDHTIPATLPIAVLCNQHTASAGELFTCAMQDYGKQGLLDVTVVGTVTYGKGTMQTLVSLGSGCATTISFALYNPPYSGNYEGIGILPDIPVELSEEAQNKSIWALTLEEDAQKQAAITSVTERVVSE